MKTLQQIEAFFELKVSGNNRELFDLCLDSRGVVAGSVFIALQGSQTHGLDFLQQAIKQDVGLVLADKKNIVESASLVLYIVNLADKLASFSAWFYDYPSKNLKIVGITGTNGKTSVAHYVAQICHQKFKTALLGTLGNGIVGELTPSTNTTLDTVSLNRQLAEFREKNVKVVLMEVSSHAIALGRIEGLKFHALALTQVTRDHLDFHGSVENYQATKKQLFIDYSAKYWVLNADDSIGVDLLGMKPKDVVVESYGLAGESRVTEIEYLSTGLQFKLEGRLLRTNLFGHFNLANILCSLAICRSLSLDSEFVLQALEKLTPVIGRMDVVANKPTIMIDYAHTDDALKSVLSAVKSHLSKTKQKLIVVFGCGGDRDNSKRSLMGRVASDFADQIILTDDNPRFESATKIMDEILEGLDRSVVNVTCIHQRAKAIAFAVRQASKDDLIVIAGKGHENYQDIQGVKYPMSDFELVKQAVANQ